MLIKIIAMYGLHTPLFLLPPRVLSENNVLINRPLICIWAMLPLLSDFIKSPLCHYFQFK